MPTSAFLVRSASSDWVAVDLPQILWATSAILILSSLTLEFARWRIRLQEISSSRLWSLMTILLGMTFVVGQLGAWLQLTSRGVYIPTNPYSSFFYILTGVHGLHLLSGLVVLFYFHFRLRQRRVGFEEISVLASLAATYWHFLAGLWIFLFAVLVFG